VVIADKLHSHIKLIKTQAPDADHRAHKGLNNAIEVSLRPTRKTENNGPVEIPPAGSVVSIRA
jgi:putative transposase